MGKSVCVIGAGLSGLAAIRGLRRAGHDVECFEAGSAIGGTWRYENDNGVSPAYRSLHTNVSRRNMQFPSLKMDGPAAERVPHGEMLAYLERYAQVNALAAQIRFDASVRSAKPAQDGGWLVNVEDEPPHHFDTLVVASGCLWDPHVPQLPGEFSGRTLHVRDYRTPESFAGKRVLVVGAGQSALDIAAEVSFVAARTLVACRQGHHLLPERLFGLPVDYFDVAALNLIPWPLARRLTQALLVSSPFAPNRGELPEPPFSITEHRWPVMATPNIRRALAQRTLALKPNIERLEGERVAFADGSSEPLDAIVFGTGYRIDFPFLPERLGRGEGFDFPLYRRILSPHADGLAFIGILDAGIGRLQVTETQVEWLSAVLAGRIELPARDARWRAIDGCGERRTRQRFASSGSHTVLCDRHAYLGVLGKDLRRRAP